MEKKRITVLPHQFNNNDYFLLKFNYEESLVSIARSLGCRWVVEENGWAIYRSRENLKALIRAFADISIFDTSKIGIIDAEEDYDERITLVPESYAQLLIRKGYSEETVQVYKSLFREFIHHFKDKKLKDLKREDLVSYIENQVSGKKLSGKSEEQLVDAINFYYTGILKRQALTYPSAKRENSGRSQRKISRKELVRMLDATPNVKHKAVMSLLYGSDLQRAQLVELEKEDVNLDKMTIHTTSGEEKNPVTLKLDEDSRELLDQYLKVYKPDKWLFEGAKGDRYSKSSIVSVIRRATYKAGIDEKIPKSKREPENEMRSGS